jgi:hypothetical protein
MKKKPKMSYLATITFTCENAEQCLAKITGNGDYYQLCIKDNTVYVYWNELRPLLIRVKMDEIAKALNHEKYNWNVRNLSSNENILESDSDDDDDDDKDFMYGYTPEYMYDSEDECNDDAQ